MIADRILVFAFEKLDALKVGEAINKNTTKNWDIFLDCAHQYNRTYKNIEINNTHTEIRKTYTFNEQIERFNGN